MRFSGTFSDIIYVWKRRQYQQNKLSSLSKDALMILCVQLSQTQSALLEQNKKLTEKFELGFIL